MVSWIGILAVIIFSQRMAELYIARTNYSWSMNLGGQEFGRRHYPLFIIIHSGWLIGWIIEAYLVGQASSYWYVWLCLFIMAQGLRYWCMASLGRYWNTRVLVIPGRASVCKGPYRFLAHPNYVAVAVEIMSVPMIFDAEVTAIIATFLNTMLILGIRLPAERTALKLLRH